MTHPSKDLIVDCKALSEEPPEKPPRRLRRLHRVWPDRDGVISYLLTCCVSGRERVLDNQRTFDCLTAFLLDSPVRYRWFGRRFVIMPDHLHLIAHTGRDAVRLGQWMKALKAVVGGLERNEGRDANGSGSMAADEPAIDREFTRAKRVWRWQVGFHDHKIRTPKSEQRLWEYICLNPVRGGLVSCPEEWPFAGEIFHDRLDGPSLVRGTPPLLDKAMLIEEEPQMGE